LLLSQECENLFLFHIFRWNEIIIILLFPSSLSGMTFWTKLIDSKVFMRFKMTRLTSLCGK
jgi:hypothetical protein